MILIFQIISAIILLLFVNILGKSSRVFGYVNTSDILEEDNLGFNFIFRILSPAIFISFLVIILYKLGLTNFIQDIWLIALWYAVIHFLMILFLNRWALINKLFYLFTQTLSILLAYWFYNISLSRGIEFILPEGANLRTEIWLIVIIFFYGLLNNYSPDYDKREFRKRNHIKKAYLLFYEKYKNKLKKEFKENEFLHRFLFSIMIAEDLNRPSTVRFLERLLHPLGLIRSTGIMQVKNNKRLSDEESLKLAQTKILNDYNKNNGNFIDTDKMGEKIRILYLLSSKYNYGKKYAIGISEIYSSLEKIEPLSLKIKKKKNINKFITEDVVENLCNLFSELKKTDPKLAKKLKKILISSL